MTKLIKKIHHNLRENSKLSDGDIDIDPTEAHFRMDDIKRLVNLAGIASDNPASPAYTGDVVETDAEVVGKHNLTESHHLKNEDVYEEDYDAEADEDDGGEFEMDIDVPGGTVEIGFNPDKEMVDGDEYVMMGDEEDNMNYMNVIDRDDYRPTPTHPDQEDMLADEEVDEDADDYDYGHHRATKRGERYRRHTAHHQDGHAGMPIRMVPARSGDNPMLDPSRYGTINENEKLNEMTALVRDGEEGLDTAFQKIRRQKATEMSKPEVIALTNAFISLLENKDDSAIRNVHTLFHLLEKDKGLIKSFKDFIN